MSRTIDDIFKNRRAGRSLPRALEPGRIIVHNYVRRCRGMCHGVNGFRWWKADAPAPRGWVRCKCGWIDLPHYREKFPSKVQERAVEKYRCDPVEFIFPGVKLTTHARAAR